MRDFAIAALILAAALLGGCVHHVHHPGPRARVLPRDHHVGAVVIVHHRPKPHRNCWRHRAHWHCARL